MAEEDLRLQEEADDKLINEAFEKLLNDYANSRHRKKVDLITKAFNFARQAHKGVRRLSGEPYIMHPIAVAQIACSEIGLGSTSICSALLHDVVEDTDYTVEDIENIFGSKIAQIVDGLTKISGGIFGEQASAQAENFKKLLLTMSDDIRVILIKICDRLHNMRTLDSQPANKQYKIAGETLYIYAPLANRLGLNKIKSELENLSFKFEHPDEFANIEAKLKSTHASRHELFDQFTAPIKEALEKMGIQYEIKDKIIATVDTSYTGEFGIREVINKSTDLLNELDVIHEKEVIQKFLGELRKDDGLYSYGEEEVRNNLIIGAVDTLLLSEDLDSMRKTFKCGSCGFEKGITVKNQSEADSLEERCPNCNELLKEDSSELLVDDFVEMAEEMNTSVEFISTETEEGMQLYRAFGGIGAILRYYVGH